mmetsp:Transcript_10777/g.14988  ORF Transcript_10777/g.14988 Transcript_10777/m.14988 type:complete len:205 (-) Transcript_10777:222-836(-)
MRMFEYRASWHLGSANDFTFDRMPSAPITMSKISSLPSSNLHLTDLSEASSTPVSLFPRFKVPSFRDPARRLTRQSLIIVKTIGVPSCISEGSFLTKFWTSILRSSLPPTVRDLILLTGSPDLFISSARPNFAKTAAPPLIWRPPPKSGSSAPFLSNTLTSSTPVSKYCKARAIDSPAGPDPMIPTRLGSFRDPDESPPSPANT